MLDDATASSSVYMSVGSAGPSPPEPLATTEEHRNRRKMCLFNHG